MRIFLCYLYFCFVIHNLHWLVSRVTVPHLAVTTPVTSAMTSSPLPLPSGETASQADSQDSDRASSSLVTAHQPGGGFKFGGSRRGGEEAGHGSEAVPLTLESQPAGGALLDTQPTEGQLDTQPTDGVSRVRHSV